MRAHRGFSLPELVLGLTLFGVLVAVTVPSVSIYLRSNRVSSGADQLVSHLRMARSNAIMEGNDYLVQFVNATTYVVVDDDGGGDGLPTSPDFVPMARGNAVEDLGERVFGPYELPAGLAFVASSGSTNPFTNEPIANSVTFPQLAGVRTIVFHPNGTANADGYVALASRAESNDQNSARTVVLRVLRPTASIEARPAGA